MTIESFPDPAWIWIWFSVAPSVVARITSLPDVPFACVGPPFLESMVMVLPAAAPAAE
ncbi:hypothetical protein [Paracoccus yeei]|uniref:hypothetical protein n=1 Tax=Paracoccus yeei TaxID=147645 RepID=UPI003BF792E7